MPLTPQDVSNKRFTPVRVRREGYDMAEVDAFLDEVEAELTRLLRENDELREKAGVDRRETSGDAVATKRDTDEATEQDSGRDTGRDTAASSERSHADRDESTDDADETSERESATTERDDIPAKAVEQPPSAPVEQTIKVTTAAEASSAATRLLELATRNADQLVDEAKAEADSILASARERQQELDSEHERRRSDLVGELDRERERLDSEVADLRSFEREYRGRLRSYFEQQLAVLGGSDDAGSNGSAALEGDHSR